MNQGTKIFVGKNPQLPVAVGLRDHSNNGLLSAQDDVILPVATVVVSVGPMPIDNHQVQNRELCATVRNFCVICLA